MDADAPHAAGAGGAECLLCPICALLQALTSARPETAQHLLAAGRELALALKSILESQAEAYDRAAAKTAAGGDGGLQRIRID
jgi:hypothetical protein